MPNLDKYDPTNVNLKQTLNSFDTLNSFGFPIKEVSYKTSDDLRKILSTKASKCRKNKTALFNRNKTVWFCRYDPFNVSPEQTRNLFYMKMRGYPVSEVS